MDDSSQQSLVEEVAALTNILEESFSGADLNALTELGVEAFASADVEANVLQRVMSNSNLPPREDEPESGSGVAVGSGASSKKRIPKRAQQEDRSVARVVI